MDYADSKNHWKVYLAIFGAIIIIASFFYSSHLTQQLSDVEKMRIDQVAYAYEELSVVEESELDMEIGLPDRIITENKSIPMIVTNEEGNITGANNYGEKRNVDTSYLRKRINILESNGFTPILVDALGWKQYIYYEESSILKLLRYFPLVQLLLIGTFIGFGYVGFSATRNAEQNRVWVGMAKETAHQLGTPISAIVAWIEHLRGINDEDEETLDVLDEFGKDVYRLELIADRFSKIGSEPDLKKEDVVSLLHKSKMYMERRASRKVVFEFDNDLDQPMYAMVNAHLFEWVIENVLRNALDALGGLGKITILAKTGKQSLDISITDTGKGIPAGKFKKVFEPGYSTKKRGWGLGLSLAKRIIEKYHAGKIFVQNSSPETGTTFVVKLPIQ